MVGGGKGSPDEGKEFQRVTTTRQRLAGEAGQGEKVRHMGRAGRYWKVNEAAQVCDMHVLDAASRYVSGHGQGRNGRELKPETYTRSSRCPPQVRPRPAPWET